MYLPNAQYNLCCDLQLLQKEGTVTAAPNFNSSGDAGVLEQAIKAKGELDVHTGKLWSMSQDVSDLETVIVLEVWHVGLQWKNFNILCWPSCTITAPSLITVVESWSISATLSLCVCMFVIQIQDKINDDSTWQCILCAGVDENTIIEVLVKRSNEQRQQIKDAYQKASGKVIQIE